MDSIPVLGALVMTGPEWIKRQIESIDYPVDNYVLFNNGGSNEVVKYIDDLFKEDHPFIKNKQICHLPSNLGVQAGWNLIFKSNMFAPYWIIASHDVSFTDGILEEMHEATKDIEVGMVYPSAGDFGWGSYDLFLMKNWVVDKIGLFDENFYPAYFEDFDHAIIIKNASIKIKAGLSKKYYHGDTFNYNISGGQTAKSCPKISENFRRAKGINQDYLIKKWGASKMTKDGEDVGRIEPHASVYNVESILASIGVSIPKNSLDASYNFDFVKQKHIKNLK